jgi:putative aldouronate transport system permease protein
MPYFLSWTVVQIAVYAFLNTDLGLVNKTLALITGNPTAINWYHNKPFWPPFLVLTNAWKGVGYQTVLYLAVISGISSDYYEAAMIDGGSKFQQAWHITIPHLRFIITISLIMAMGGIVRGDFGLHFSVTRNTGMIYSVTDIIDTYIYRGLMNMNNIGMSAAASLYQSSVGLIMILAANWVVTRIDPDSAMF